MMKTTKDNVSLELASRLTARVNEAWESGELLSRVTPTTQQLLRWWLAPEHCEQRRMNFHQGQRQAILNIIYLHEVAGVRTVLDTYEHVAPDLMDVVDIGALARKKYQMPKYAVKMATGTGKTWVMHALLLWQMLNARAHPRAGEDWAGGDWAGGDWAGGDLKSPTPEMGISNPHQHAPHQHAPHQPAFTQRFLIVAPGLIVYDRLLDAFCGRMRRGSDVRDIQTNDFYLNQELLLPPHMRQEAFTFIQNNVVTKDDGIGRKVTGDGLIALTNWHLFENQMDDDDGAPADDSLPLTAPQIIDELLPVRPGKSAGNELGAIDRRTLSGSDLAYLAALPDLMVINDEAHHIHERPRVGERSSGMVKRGGETEEVEWQQALNRIAATKGHHFIQVDFSATPYDTRGTGERLVKLYFPHIVVDFDLSAAMHQGLVKTLLLDKRQELTDLQSLDFRALRDDRGKVTGLSGGQMLMLRAGLTKLRMLETEFLRQDAAKNPKMLVMCEDTTVSPFVVDFLKGEGLSDDDVVQIDSSRRGEVKEDEWNDIKTRLFDIDRCRQPRVIVSVLMLREGFDVNNICVIVPLRSSEAPILLEQTIGRGLRLMWREDEWREVKADDRQCILRLKQPPLTYIDQLSIIEHPAFQRFYDELLSGGLASVDDGAVGQGGATGDVITVGLKEDYERYDFTWPVIMRDAEEELTEQEIPLDSLHPFTMYPLQVLRRFLAQQGEKFLSQEITSKTQFGVYHVTGDLFTAASYNEYLQKIIRAVTRRFDSAWKRRDGVPMMQVNEAAIAAIIDRYIRTRLFAEPFNPFGGSDWKILLSKGGVVTDHIVKEVSTAIYHMQQHTSTTEAVVEHTAFSSVAKIKMREGFSLPLQKTIYERQGYPSHGGGLEKQMLLFLERDGGVERYLKINEYQHPFAVIYYLRDDGLMATYHPDFIVGTREKVYLIETKGNDKVFDRNVQRKQRAALEWTRKISALPPEQRMQREWVYVLLSEDNFYSLSGSGATLTDMCELARVSPQAALGNLFFEE